MLKNISGGVRQLNVLFWYSPYGLKMEGVVVVLYYESDIVSTSKEILSEYPNGPKLIKTSKDRLLPTLRKAITNVIRGGRSLLDFFFTINLYI